MYRQISLEQAENREVQLPENYFVSIPFDKLLEAKIDFGEIHMCRIVIQVMSDKIVRIIHFYPDDKIDFRQHKFNKGNPLSRWAYYIPEAGYVTRHTPVPTTDKDWVGYTYDDMYRMVVNVAFGLTPSIPIISMKQKRSMKKAPVVKLRDGYLEVYDEDKIVEMHKLISSQES